MVHFNGAPAGTSAQTGVGHACVYAFPPGSTTPTGSTGITNDNGNYTISGLIPGSYTVSVDPICGGHGTASPYAYATLASPVTVTSGGNSGNESFDLVSDQQLTPAPPTTGVPAADFGTPTSALTTSSSATSLTQSELGATASVSVPAGALASGTTTSVYPVTNPAVLAQSLPAGQAYVASFAVSWRAPDGTTPTALAPITMTITDPNIVAGDTIYEVTSNGLVVAGTATVSGSATVTFTNDPTFVVTERTLIAQSTLSIVTQSGQVGTALTLMTSGGLGTGAISFAVGNGTASGCSISNNALSSTSAGTCLVTAAKAADATYSAISSTVTAIAMALPVRPGTVTLDFAAKSSALTPGAKRTLVALSRELLAGASVTVTGFAKGNAKLAKSRASVAANYLKSSVAVHVTIKTVTSTTANKVTVMTTKQ